MNSLLTDLSPRQLREAADLQERIQSLQQELSQVLGPVARPDHAATTPQKRKMSPAAIAKIRAAAKARWAAKKRKQPIASAHKPKGSMSAAAKARLSAIAKARWKKARAAGRTAL